MVRFAARALWVVPVLLVMLAFNQAFVAAELRATWKRGQPAMAKVLNFETTNRADVTYGYVDLKVELDDGRAITQNQMSLPQVMWSRVKDRDSLAVRVRPGAAQEIIIERLMPGHWLIAASQVGISFLGAVLFAAWAWVWNRQLRRKNKAVL